MFDTRHNFNLQHYLTVAAAFDAHVQAADLMHEMKLVGVQAFTEALVDEATGTANCEMA